MASSHSFPFRLSSRFQRISPLLLWLLFLMRVDALDGRDEVEILQQFKESMQSTKETVLFLGTGWVQISNSGGPWSYWSTWKTTDKIPCKWVGVTCTTNDTVLSLDLSGWNLYQLTNRSLEILSNLEDLRKIDFADNHLGTGPPYHIPNTIQTLTRLESLHLARNNFSGKIPPNISACRNLKQISLESNHLTCNLDSLHGLTDLQVLLLTRNQLSGPFPVVLMEMSSLVNVDLASNMFTGIVPSLPKLTNLLSLNLNYNNFTELEPLFPGVERVEHVSTKWNQLQGTIPSYIGNLLDLKFLDLSGNQLSGGIPFEFSGQLSNSLWLDLSQNQLMGKIPANLLQPEVFGNQAVSINLSHNHFEGNIPLNGTKVYTYYHLDLSHNNLSGQIPSIYSNIKIYSLTLQDNILWGDVVDFLYDSSGLTSLTDLRLGNNFFSGDLSRIANINASFHYLEVVNLSNNNLRMSTTQAFPNPLRAMLDFFNGGGRLTDFWVGGNNFSGVSLPRDFGYYSTLKTLDFGNNHLTGEISGEAFNSTSTCSPSLQFLNLSHNDATGPVPESIVTLTSLTTLDVTHNDLAGQLPYIPPNSAFYNPDFYANNPGLCALPLTRCPQDLSRGVQWWVWLIVAGSVVISLGSFLAAMWRWGVYRKRHQQDADLIKTLMERQSTTLMSLRELKKATDNFAESAQIGEGGFGTVYTGKLNDGTLVAIKRSKREGSEKGKEQFLNEVRILSQVNHRNLVKLLGCCMENKVALLVFEFISNGTLQEHLPGKVGMVGLSWRQRLLIAIQTADALNYLHSAATFPIFHRDVKSANILLDDDLNAKVSDFGISRLASPQATHVSTIAIKGTLGYIDPEYYTSYQLTDKSDVYSFGVVLLELISAKPAIDFLRGMEGTSLVTLASAQIEREDLGQLIDPTLVEIYTDPTGKGRESILNVGKLAMTCLDRQSRVRPSMKEVWKELQNLWLEFEGTSRFLGSLDEDEDALFQILL